MREPNILVREEIEYNGNLTRPHEVALEFRVNDICISFALFCHPFVFFMVNEN